MSRERCYVVFAGREPGIYREWSHCQAQVDGFSGAQYRSFPSMEEALGAWIEAGGDPMPFEEPGDSDDGDWGDLFEADDLPAARPAGSSARPLGPRPGARVGPPPGSIAVDAACSGNPGPMEYRGVDIDTGVELFRVGPMRGTNNIGEFLAIVHGWAWLQAQGRAGPLYSDSKVAIGWVQRRGARTTLARSAATESVWTLLDRAHRWLRGARPPPVELRKWPTRQWGEIPADFGRK